MKKPSVLVSSMFASTSMCAIIGGLLLSADATYAFTLNVVNPGFEADQLSDGGFTINSFEKGWRRLFTGGNAGVFNPPNTAYKGASTPGSSFELTQGENVAYTNGSEIEQNLTAVLKPNFIYKLSVEVGQRLDAPFPSTGAFIELLAGSNVIASVNPISPIPSTGGFITTELTFTSSGNSPLLGENLGIRLGSNDFGAFFTGQVNFDNVSLRATPVPEPLGILGSGMALGFGVLMKRQYSRKRNEDV